MTMFKPGQIVRDPIFGRMVKLSFVRDIPALPGWFTMRGQLLKGDLTPDKRGRKSGTIITHRPERPVEILQG